MFALLRGDLEEKWVAAIILIGWYTEPFVHDHLHPRTPEPGLFVSDVVVLILFLLISFRCRKLWTLFLSASQLNAVITHITAATHLHMPIAGYFGLNWIWSGNGLLLTLLVGTIQSMRERAQARRASEPSKDERAA